MRLLFLFLVAAAVITPARAIVYCTQPETTDGCVVGPYDEGACKLFDAGPGAGNIACQGSPGEIDGVCFEGDLCPGTGWDGRALVCTWPPMDPTSTVKRCYEAAVVVPPLDVAQLSASFDGLEYYDTASLAAGFALEVAQFSGGTAAADDVSVSSVTTSGKTTTITSVLPLTAAQILQQFLSTTESRTMSALAFPIFSTTTQVLVTVVGTPTSSSNATFDFTCREGANCYGVGSCYNGLCGCVPDAGDVCTGGTLPPGVVDFEQPQMCVSGATLATPFADACASTQSTVDQLVYIGGPCETHGSGMVNLYPRRRFCQSRDYAASMDRNVFTGLMGNPYDYGNSTGGLQLFTISSPLTMDQLRGRNGSVAEGVVATRAYVSNLYDGAAPVISKVWAYMEFNATMYSANSVQLTRLVFLDAIEGDRRYYFHDNRWQAYPGMLPIRAYAYWDQAPAWECQLQHIYNPRTLACEPGCNNGFVGVNCDVPFLPVCSVRSFDANTTLYVGYDCDSAACLAGYFLGAFGCVSELELPVDLPPVAVVPEEGSSSAVDPVVVSCAVITGIFAIALGYTLLRPRPSTRRPQVSASASGPYTRGRAKVRSSSQPRATSLTGIAFD